MSFHSNFEQWLAMTERQNCPVCQQLPMPEGMVDIVELPNSWLSAESIDCLKGACHLVAKQHVIELYELNDDDLLAFMKEVQLCAKALKTVTNAVKINYETHGNSVPHLHVHLYPRYRDDPFPGKAIDYSRKKRLYSDEEFKIFVGEMQKAIAVNSRPA
jgi:diadenosine tetraphosphate (Ap4A) HIT family hydrolase